MDFRASTIRWDVSDMIKNSLGLPSVLQIVWLAKSEVSPSKPPFLLTSYGGKLGERKLGAFGI